MKRPQYSISALVVFVALAAVGFATYRHYNPPPVYPLPAYGGGGILYSYAFDFQYAVEVNDETIEAAPAWDRHNPNPPLSANEAMVRAEKVRQRLLDEKQLPDNIHDGWWAIAAAELTPCDDERGLWYWLVRFQYFMTQTGPGHDLRLVVPDGRHGHRTGNHLAARVSDVDARMKHVILDGTYADDACTTVCPPPTGQVS